MQFLDIFKSKPDNVATDALEHKADILGDSVVTLKERRDDIALSLNERLRLEDEGGNPLTKKQAAETEELTQELSQIDGILPTLEHIAEAAKAQTDA